MKMTKLFACVAVSPVCLSRMFQFCKKEIILLDVDFSPSVYISEIIACHMFHSPRKRTPTSWHSYIHVTTCATVTASIQDKLLFIIFFLYFLTINSTVLGRVRMRNNVMWFQFLIFIIISSFIVGVFVNKKYTFLTFWHTFYVFYG